MPVLLIEVIVRAVNVGRDDRGELPAMLVVVGPVLQRTSEDHNNRETEIEGNHTSVSVIDIWEGGSAVTCGSSCAP